MHLAPKSLLVIIVLSGIWHGDGMPTLAEDSSPGSWIANDFHRKTIYRSPQTPGYTAWPGAWIMPDESLMISLTQLTGPVEGRPRAPREVQQKIQFVQKENRDFTGLQGALVYLRSTDGGETWDKVAEDKYESACGYIAPNGQQEVFPDGSILRGVFGYFQPLDPVPQSAYLQRSIDGGKTWGPPQVLGDPATDVYRLTRIRQLRDGRLIATGGRARTPATSDAFTVWALWEPLLLVSEDQGETWSDPIEFLPPEKRTRNWTEEWDTAELPNGDLLCIFRRIDPKHEKTPSSANPGPDLQIRWQGLLKKDGDTWVLAEDGPSIFPHSGHPELLATQEGVILHIATTGIHGTVDGGETWQPIDFPELQSNPHWAAGYRSRYYPESLQVVDGRIYVFSHVGSDNDYGAVDQSIVMDTFRLSRQGGEL